MELQHLCHEHPLILTEKTIYSLEREREGWGVELLQDLFFEPPLIFTEEKNNDDDDDDDDDDVTNDDDDDDDDVKNNDDDVKNNDDDDDDDDVKNDDDDDVKNEDDDDDDAKNDDDDDDVKNEDDVEICCYGCEQKITGSYYSCTNCSFFLHKLCAKLPTKIKHPMYLKSPLTLHPEKSNNAAVDDDDDDDDDAEDDDDDDDDDDDAAAADDNADSDADADVDADADDDFKCHVCYKCLHGFQYRCSPFTRDTNFCVHMRCAARAISVEHKFHQHPLTPILRPALFECHACGTQHKHGGLSYICSTCDFWIHEDCAFLPTTFKLSTHVHSLTLSYTRSYRALGCRICKKAFRSDFWIYQCEGCRYFAHVDCVEE